MNADERNTDQQDKQRDMAPASQQQQPSTQGRVSTGQASYGNSGQSSSETLSQNDSDLGRKTDLGQSGDRKLFSASDDDLGSSAAAGDQGINSDPSQMRSDDQSFEDQGQGALSEDTMGSDGTTDFGTERSLGRESDIEGSSL